MPLLYVPNEILLQISNHLDFSHYYSLLKCNRRLAGLLMPGLLKYTLFYPTTRGLHALQMAADRGDIDTVKSLVGLGLPPLIPGGEHICTFCPDLSPTAITTLLSSHYFPVDARDSMGRTPLFIAAGDNLMAVQCLLAHGADVNAVNTARQTPLMKASKYDASDIIRILLTDESIDVNKQDCHGRTALYLAASRGQVNATAALLADSRIDVNIESQKRFVPWVLSTPLKIAWKNGHKEIVKMFLERSDVADRYLPKLGNFKQPGPGRARNKG